MNTLLITYELDDYKRDYEAISTRIKSYNIWAKPFNRTWLICTSCDTASVRDELRNAIGGRGQVLVINVTGSAWGTYNVSSEVNTWLHQKI